jgi:hypothetical protein
MSSARATTKSRNDGAWRIALFAVCLSLIVWAALWAASLMSDNGRIPSELAVSASESTVMVCADGTIVHAGDSLLSRLLSDGHFRCTAWHMRGVRSHAATGAVDWPTSPRR